MFLVNPTHISYNSLFSSLATSPTLGQPSHESIPSSADTVPQLHTPSDIPSTQFSVAQLSRAGASAIRVSLAHENTWDAFHLLHSMRWSYHHHRPETTRLPKYKFKKPMESFEPVDFGHPVSPRLAAHCLVHGLLRNGQRKLAAKLALQMMDDGVEFRAKTFESLLGTLHPHTIVAGEDRTGYNRIEHFQPRTYTPEGKEVLDIRTAMPADPLTRYAVRLLRDARKHRYQRTRSMFEIVINACIVQGEIIVASLLLVILIKDFQLRQTCSRLTEQAVADTHTPMVAIVARDRGYFPRRGYLFLPEHPPNESFAQIVDFLSVNIAKGPLDPLFPECSQCLAILASALDTQQLPTRRLSRLLRLLYSYPSNDLKVWARQRDGEMRLVNAYRYFHKVLLRLSQDLPSQFPYSSHDAYQTKTWLRPLDVESYNALIHYALRHRYSPKLAQRVITHMTDLRQPPLSPNSVTYGILLRSSSLLRRNDLAEQVLQKVRDSMPIKMTLASDAEVEAAAKDPTKDAALVDRPLGSDPPAWNSRISGLVKQIQSQGLEVPVTKNPLRIDPSLLTSYITHLISNDQCEAVVDILFEMLPELAAVDHPDWGRTTAEHRRILLTMNREKCVQRAITYGPYFFTSVLNALRKAGKTGLTERVWMLAKEAETASWEAANACDPSMPETQRPKPWVLPVHAYTVMMQCYGNEARKGLAMKRAKSRQELGEHLSAGWMAKPTDKMHVIGWARFFLRSGVMDETPDMRRNITGPKVGALLYHSMREGMQSVYESLMRLQKTRGEAPRGIEFPKPDERFFNALLDLFGRRPSIFVRRRHVTRSHWRQRLHRARERYLRRDILSPYWTPMLEQIAVDMSEAGFSVPAGFREALIGRLQGISTELRPEEDRMEGKRSTFSRPYAFPLVPRRPKFRSHATQTVKVRGLPVKSTR